MPNYTAPIEDMMFLFNNLRNNKNYNEIEKYKEVNSELVKSILDDGLRTKDIFSKGNKEVSTQVMGDAIIACLQK